MPYLLHSLVHSPKTLQSNGKEYPDSYSVTECKARDDKEKKINKHNPLKKMKNVFTWSRLHMVKVEYISFLFSFRINLNLKNIIL